MDQEETMNNEEPVVNEVVNTEEHPQDNASLSQDRPQSSKLLKDRKYYNGIHWSSVLGPSLISYIGQILKILGVVRLMKVNQFGYGYLQEIIIRRTDLKEYSFKEGDFSKLHLNDIEDLFLLYVQRKIHNLSGDEIFHMVNALRMFTRSIIIQRRVEDV
ncbi:hypothetical protein Tco_0668440 [Tanacetum coccineum]